MSHANMVILEHLAQKEVIEDLHQLFKEKAYNIIQMELGEMDM